VEELFIRNTISINAPAVKIWDVLTNPEMTKIYMFGCEAVSDWKVGSELLWKGSYEGKEMVFVKGHIVTIEPTTKLVYSTFDPNSTIADIPENYLNVTYLLSEDNGVTTFTVTQGDYNKVEEGEKRYKEGSNNGEGWNPVLMEIKKLAEK
jgi:uncharacterized protein YndB with AHSA1/START domain